MYNNLFQLGVDMNKQKRLTLNDLVLAVRPHKDQGKNIRILAYDLQSHPITNTPYERVVGIIEFSDKTRTDGKTEWGFTKTGALGAHVVDAIKQVAKTATIFDVETVGPNSYEGD